MFEFLIKSIAYFVLIAGSIYICLPSKKEHESMKTIANMKKCKTGEKYRMYVFLNSGETDWKEYTMS